MRLGFLLIFKLPKIFYILSLIFCVYSKQYSISEINKAFDNIVPVKSFNVEIDNQRGCWTSKIIPYMISDKFSKDEIKHITSKILQIHSKSCLRWVKVNTLTTEKKYVKFEKTPKPICEKGEYSVFRKNAAPRIMVQILLHKACFRQEAVIHEILHGLGLHHEHQRLDRDCYVIVEDNPKVKRTQALKVNDDLTFEKWPYDKRSLLHYKRDFELIKDRAETFWTKYLFLWKYRLGDSYGFWGSPEGQMSYMDVFKLNYRFCDGPDYCDVHRDECERIEKEEVDSGCKELYLGIVNGTFKKSA